MDTQPKPFGRLIVISEPAVSLLHSRRGTGGPGNPERRSGIEITQTPFLIGRNHDNTLIIADDQVSAHHARIVSDGQQCIIEDIESTNGTFVDGIKIGAPATLKAESLIKIGKTILKFEVVTGNADR